VKPGEHRIYNLGNGSDFSVREIVETAREVTGRGIEATHTPRRAGDPAVLVASSRKIREELG
jgi:UDP-glucose 4-epimerase